MYIISQNLGSQLQTDIPRINQKVVYSTTIHDNPMIRFETPWSKRLYTGLNITYRCEGRNIGRLSEDMSNFSPLLGITYRFRDSGSGKTRAELRHDLNFSFYRSHKF